MLIPDDANNGTEPEQVMIEKVHVRRFLPSATQEESDEADEHAAFSSLRILAAQLLLVSGAGATVQHLSNRTDETDAGRSLRWPEAAGWAPLLVGSAAAAAQVAHALRPTDSTRAALRILNGAVLGASAAEIAHTLYASYSGRTSSPAAGLTFGLTGVLGFLLDREELATETKIERLERRASIVERWVPRRRPKLDRVVVHV